MSRGKLVELFRFRLTKHMAHRDGIETRCKIQARSVSRIRSTSPLRPLQCVSLKTLASNCGCFGAFNKTPS